MRIGIVVPTFPLVIGSPELWMAMGLSDLGHDVTVYSTERKGDRERLHASATETPPWGPLKFRIRWITSVPIVYPEAAVPLRPSEVYGDRPDVVFLQEDYPFTSQLLARSLARRGIPYIFSCERYKPAERPLVRYAVRVMDRTVLPPLWRRAQTLTFHSQASLRFFASRGAPADRLHCIPSATNCQFFSPASAGPAVRSTMGVWPNDGRVRILCVGRLASSKGLDTLVDAASGLASAPDGPVFVLHGRGPDEGRLRRQIARSAPTGAIRLDTASLPFSQLPAFYRSADIYVQPSRHEPFGLSLLEAMACGLPVVGSDTGGLSDLVAPGENGLRVPPDDVVALREALRTLSADSSLRARMGKNSRERAERQFEMKQVARAYEPLIEALA